MCGRVIFDVSIRHALRFFLLIFYGAGYQEQQKQVTKRGKGMIGNGQFTHFIELDQVTGFVDVGKNSQVTYAFSPRFPF